MESLHFTDIWRLFHPVEREFTFYSPTMYLLGSITLLQDYVSLQDSGLQPNLHLWHFSSFLYKNADFQTSMQAAWEEFLSTNSPHMDNPKLFWEACKAFIRGWLISYAASFKKHALCKYQKASSRLKSAQHSLFTQNVPSGLINLTKRAFNDATFHRFDNKSGKFLARRWTGPYCPHILLPFGTPQAPSNRILKK